MDARRIPLDASQPCLLWTRRLRHGYPVMGGHVAAHRRVYRDRVGPLTPGMDVDHICFTPACVNPAHLRLLDPIENRRRQRSASKTSCIHGHPYDAGNTYRRSSHGQRDCRTCIRDRVRRYRLRRIAAQQSAAA